VAAPSDKMLMIDGDASLATRAAWLYFAAGLTQSEVATRLNIQSTKAHRLIARASREGMIRVFVEGPVAECVALENTIAQRFGLTFCRVAPDLGRVTCRSRRWRSKAPVSCVRSSNAAKTR